MLEWKSLRGIFVRQEWNVNPDDRVTIARLISELEGATYILNCLEGTEDEVDFINEMKKKYYRMYFRWGKDK